MPGEAEERHDRYRYSLYSNLKSKNGGIVMGWQQEVMSSPIGEIVTGWQQEVMSFPKGYRQQVMPVEPVVRCVRYSGYRCDAMSSARYNGYRCGATSIFALKNSRIGRTVCEMNRPVRCLICHEIGQYVRFSESVSCDVVRKRAAPQIMIENEIFEYVFLTGGPGHEKPKGPVGRYSVC